MQSPESLKLNILVIDDHEAMARSVAEFLRVLGGHSTRYMLFPKQALALPDTKLFSFHGIVTDYQMPGMNGVRFAWEVRKRQVNQEGHPDPLILLHTMAERGDRRLKWAKEHQIVNGVFDKGRGSHIGKILEEISSRAWLLRTRDLL